jgi:PAS domain S-box-containing protein
MKLLYVEDEPAHVILTQRTLEENLNEDFALLSAESIGEAIQVLDSKPDIDLVLTDLRLPDGSGIDLLNRINQRDKPVPVVLVTGQGDEENAVAALKAGAADYLVKQSDYLLRLPVAISNAVAHSRLVREQAALREAEVKYQSLVEQIPAVVFLDDIDENETTLYMSPRIEELTGFTRAEWFADPLIWINNIHPEDREKIAKEDLRTHEQGEPFRQEYRFRRRDGRVIWIKEDTNLIRDKDGNPLYWQGILLDVTREKESQAAIEESEERFRRIFHASPIATCVVTLMDGRFLDANKAFLELTGTSLENLVGRTSLELGYWDNMPNNGRKSFITRLHREKTIQGMEVRYDNVPGGPRDTLAFYELIELSGEPCVLAMFYDITEQKKAQRALQAERDFALQVLNTMGQGLTITGRDGVLEYVNPAYAFMIGYSQDEMIGKQPADFTAAADLENLQEQRKLRMRGVTSTYESTLVHKNGHEVPVMITGVPRMQNNQISGTIAVITDLTEIKRTEESLARQVKELTILHAVAMASAEGASEGTILDNTIKIISSIYTDVCGILLLNDSGDRLIPHPSYFGADITSWKEGFPISQGISGRAVRLGRAIRVDNVTLDADFMQITPDIQSELCVPIRVHERIIGVLNVESRRNAFFDDDDERFLNTVAGGLGSALERIRLFEAEQRQARESELLREATAALGTSLDLQTIFNIVLDSLKRIIPYDSASIFLKYSQDEMIIAAAAGFDDSNAVVGRRIGTSAKWSELARSKKTLVMEDARADPLFEKWEGSEYIRGWMGVPMVAQDEVIGFINLDSQTPGAFTDRQATIAQTFANAAAVAIGNARLYQDAIRAAERRAVLHQISQDVVRFSLDAEQIYTSIHGAASRLMACDVFTISLRNELKNTNDFVYRVEGDHRYPFESIDTDIGLTSKIMQTGRSVILRNDSEIEMSGAARFGPPRHVRSAVLVPMRIGDRIVGTISTQSYKPNAYGEEEKALLEMLATHAATAFENARLYDETQRRVRELETINRISASLRLAQSLEDMLPILLNETLELLQTSDGSIWLYDHSNSMLVQQTARGLETGLNVTSLRPHDGIVGRTFTSGERYISHDLKNDPLLFEENRPSIQAGMGCICLPIRSTAGPVGVLMVLIESDRRITSDEIHMLTILAEIAGNAIHRAELYDQSQEQVRRVTALRDIDSAIASSTDLRVTLNILIDHTLRHLKVDAVAVMIYRPELQSLIYFCGSGFRTPSPSRPLVRIGEGLAGQVVMKGRIDHVIDLKNAREARRDPMLLREGFVTYIGVPLVVKGQIKGVFEIFHRSPLSPNADWMQFLQTLAGQAAIAIDNSHLFENLQRSNQELTQAYDTTLEGWARTLELRDRETEGHTRRVTDLTLRLAGRLGISDEELINIYRGVLLHDIGKMGVPDQILRKTGPLTESEWDEMRRHPQLAHDLLSPITYLHGALDIPYCHHEHWDGSGYPRGLHGDQIPLAARIFSVVDIWDALLSDRTYRKAWPRERVLKYIQDISGTILDPRIVETFLTMIAEMESDKG